jgi:hypothetical protein
VEKTSDTGTVFLINLPRSLNAVPESPRPVAS